MRTFKYGYMQIKNGVLVIQHAMVQNGLINDLRQLTFGIFFCDHTQT